ncbi:hypothetical protein AHF37_05758 [Paragonimus kellicotti]|nr:hypothetical protein AHF37_05758 [Paragonimus kellicotti]
MDFGDKNLTRDLLSGREFLLKWCPACAIRIVLLSSDGCLSIWVSQKKHYEVQYLFGIWQPNVSRRTLVSLSSSEMYSPRKHWHEI